MPKLAVKSSEKAGLAPGSLVFIGERKSGGARITVLEYDGDNCRKKEIKDVEECLSSKDRPAVTWINVDGVLDADMMGRLGECFGLHPLVMEDVMNTEQRPKIEDYVEYVFIVLKALSYNKDGGEINIEQVSMVVGPDYVISFQEREGDVFAPVVERLQNGKGRLRTMGADYLAYTLIDAVVDNYFVILEKLGERVEFLDETLVTRPSQGILRAMHDLKTKMLFLRKSVWPLREVISGLERGDSPHIKDSTRVYLKDVYDHTIQVIDTLETYRDIMTEMLDLYLSSISNRMTEVMKVLTVIATIFIPLTFITGVYGMNFRHMPELEWRWGYPAVMAAMSAIAFLMVICFRRKKWL
ncbi:MAG TPA: magnesium/cobalt transporter CorA [Bacillota bacterium]|nr:magnesium/cobalt transporter CorA [Bacillota bacterium]